MAIEKITFVPTVKAYPALLSGLDEAVCVAGFRIGIMTTPEWVRLFPVHFRELENEQKFKQWDELLIDVERSKKDARPESRLPREHTIELIRPIGMDERRQIVDSMPQRSMCEIIEEQRTNSTSLGIVRPREVLGVDISIRPAEDVRRQQERVNAAASQEKLFGKQLAPLEIIPHRYSYRYLCETQTCNGHSQGIIDWEVTAAYRSWRNSYPDYVERVREKWLGQLCAPDRDTRFFVGNMHQYPQSFLVLGVFWPKR
jgi:hypothetical protein